MKKSYKPVFIAFLFALIIVTACETERQNKSEFGTATNELIEMLDADPDLKTLLTASIELAKEIT